MELCRPKRERVGEVDAGKDAGRREERPRQCVIGGRVNGHRPPQGLWWEGERVRGACYGGAVVV